MNFRLQNHLKTTLIGGMFAWLSFMHGIVGAVPEVEPNDVQTQAQVLLIPSEGLAVTALMGIGTPDTTDLDIYAFDAKAGDVPTIMVVSDGSWDPFLVLYDANGNILDMNDDAYPMNPDSVSPLDSRIDTYRIDADGTYYAVVTPVPRYLDASFTVVFTDPGVGGAYNLQARGISPAVMPDPEPIPDPGPTTGGGDDPDEPRIVTIKVKHWHGNVAMNGKKSKGKKRGIPVAIMSDPDFDAMKIDKHSLTFGATGDEASLMHCRKKGKDVKDGKVKDGLKDMVCYFKVDACGFKEGDVSGIVRGTWVNKDGKQEKFEGSAALSVLIVSNEKTESWHVRHGVDPHGKKYEEKKAKRSKHEKHEKGKNHDKHTKID